MTIPTEYAKRLQQNLGKNEAKRVAEETLKSAEASVEKTEVAFWKQVVNLLKK